MIRLTCDNCEKAIDASDDLAGQKIKCPACGDVNVVPAATRGTATLAPDRAAEAGLPPANGPEVSVMRVRPALFRSRPIRVGLLVLGAVGGLVGAGVLALSLAMLPAAAIAAVVGILCAGVLGYWKLLCLGEVLEVTNKRTVERNGILSKRTTEVRHQDIRNIQVSQTFHERVFKVGRIGISSAGQDGLEIVVDNIPNPEELRRVIDLYRTM